MCARSASGAMAPSACINGQEMSRWLDRLFAQARPRVRVEAPIPCASGRRPAARPGRTRAPPRGRARARARRSPALAAPTSSRRASPRRDRQPHASARHSASNARSASARLNPPARRSAAIMRSVASMVARPCHPSSSDASSRRRSRTSRLIPHGLGARAQASRERGPTRPTIATPPPARASSARTAPL